MSVLARSQIAPPSQPLVHSAQPGGEKRRNICRVTPVLVGGFSPCPRGIFGARNDCRVTFHPSSPCARTAAVVRANVAATRNKMRCNTLSYYAWLSKVITVTVVGWARAYLLPGEAIASEEGRLGGRMERLVPRGDDNRRIQKCRFLSDVHNNIST